MRRDWTGVALAIVATASALATAQSTPPGAGVRVTDGVSYAASGQATRPANYREWVYLTT